MANKERAFAAQGKGGFLLKSLDLSKLYARPAYYMASNYAELGRYDEAFVWLQKAIQQRDPEVLYSKVAPEFDGMSADPRFKKLLLQIGLIASNELGAER